MNRDSQRESELEMRWCSSIAADQPKHQRPQLVMKWISISFAESATEQLRTRR